MIDIETLVYTPIAQAVRSEFPGSSVAGEYVRKPSQFPHVQLVEMDNYTSISRRDTSRTEKFSTVMYEVNVYSNLKDGKKAQCREVLDLIDSMMYGLNFTRIAMTPVPNMNDSSIYRITARYRAETDGTNLFRI